MELNVAVTLRIMPDDAGVDMERIKSKTEKIAEKYGKVHSTEIEPIAFGLNALKIAILLNDSRGGIDDIQEDIKKINGVGEVDVVDLNRL